MVAPDIDRMVRCDDCGARCRESELALPLEDTPDLNMRLDPGSIVPAGECACGALAYIDENQEPSKYIVAFYDCDREYGGSEEGGWWYDTGRLMRVSREFANQDAAYAYCRKLNDKLHRWQDRAGVPSTSSVLSRGRVYASVYEGKAPPFFPERTPHYE